ncbi:MAG: terpene cyclase/mutase family protein [Planctomycetota bacterium]|nr:terpene cyclase/mutase family protein [Planctomycetota bacterium]
MSAYEREVEEDQGQADEEIILAQDAMPIWVRKAPPWIMSGVIHAGLILIFTQITFAEYSHGPKDILIAAREKKEQDYDPTLKRAFTKTPKIEFERQVEHPIIMLEEEVEITKDIPKGTDLNNLSNKNLDGQSVVDAFGVGGGAAGAYGQRWGRGSFTHEGGSAGTERAVLAGLQWLVRHQDEDGRWNSDDFNENCSKSKCGDAGFAYWDGGVTGLALLAFLGAGHTHRHGKFRQTVRKGLNWLKKNQKQGGALDGAFGYVEDEPGRPKEEWIYNHAICTMAICEAYAVSRDFTLKKHAQRAVDFCLRAQNPNFGWRYGVRSGDNDTSVTGWMVLALKAAKTAELNVPKTAFMGARSWFDRATSQSGVTGYRAPDGSSSYLPMQQGKFEAVPCMTAVAVLCRIFTGQKKSDEVIKKGERELMKYLPSWPKDSTKPVNMYYWYYGTYAMFQLGGRSWREWNKAMKPALLPTQRQGGDEDGSWDAVGEWGIAGGRVYSTAINVLTLEIYYRYERAQK